MGYLKERHGMMMIGRVPEGTCPECGVAHDLEQTHNRDSLAYGLVAAVKRLGMRNELEQYADGVGEVENNEEC